MCVCVNGMQGFLFVYNSDLIYYVCVGLYCYGGVLDGGFRCGELASLGLTVGGVDIKVFK